MGNSFAANAFANNFVKGFSFVDEIKRQRKADERFEVRLQEEKQERSFQRTRQQRSDKRIGTLFDQQQEDRTGRLEDQANAEEGDRFALQNPNATIDELSQFPNSPEARAAIKRQNEQARISGAIRGAGTIGRGNQVTASPNGPSLSEAVTQQPTVQTPGGQPAQNAPGLPTMNLEERAAEAQLRAEAEGTTGEPGFNFAPDRGVRGLETVSEEEFNKFNREFQDKGFFGKIGDVVVGQGSQTLRAAEDVAGGVFNAPGRIRGAITGEDINPATQNVGQEFGGELNLPGEFTTTEEFEAMTAEGRSQADIQAASARNFEITADYVRRGRRPGSMDIGAFSRQGAALASSDEARRAAIAAQDVATRDAQAFLDPATAAESQIGQLAVEDPAAAVVKYMETRATLQGTDINLANKMDRAMLPILDAAETDFRAENASLDPDGPKGRKVTTALANLQHSRNVIAKGQPSISREVGIKPAGLKVGDQPRVQDVADEMFNPDRVVPTQNTGGAVQTAAIVAGRIAPNKRLNETQINSLATLAQAGWIDKPTALSVMMTGAWPPGKNPNGIAKIQEAGGNVYGLTDGGGVVLIQQGKANVPDPAPTREIKQEQIDWVSEGIRSQFPNMEDSQVNSLLGIMYENPSWVRSRFNTSQEDMRLLGIKIAESKVLSGKKFAEMGDGFLWFNGNTKGAPTTNQILMDVDMRDRLVTEFDMEYKPLPDLKELSGLDPEAARQNLREGRAGQTARINADQYDDDQAVNAYARSVYMELDAAGRLEVDADGNVTILPPAEAE